mgnify:CR=1 FL=1
MGDYYIIRNNSFIDNIFFTWAGLWNALVFPIESANDNLEDCNILGQIFFSLIIAAAYLPYFAIVLPLGLFCALFLTLLAIVNEIIIFLFVKKEFRSQYRLNVG